MTVDTTNDAEIAKLETEIRHHNALYWDKQAPEISDYDYDKLTKKVAEIKAQFGEETKVIINANPDITYEVVVAHMDAIRTDGVKTLFPDVLLAAGVN